MKYSHLMIFAAVVCLVPGAIWACGMAWPPSDAPALMKGERTLIVWDNEKKHEDFIRSVDFQTKSENMGFIVPVPSIPEVADAPDNIFRDLDQEMERQRPSAPRVFDGTKGMDGGALPRGGVNVVANYELANFNVKVLQADSIEPLAEWLDANKFGMRPALKKWLESYLQKKYYFTVFKFKKPDVTPSSLGYPFAPPPVNGITSKAVRISFAADAPYYPYRDSEDMVHKGDRHMLLYILSDAPYAPDFLADPKLAKAEGWKTQYCERRSAFKEFFLGKEVRPKFSNRVNTEFSSVPEISLPGHKAVPRQGPVLADIVDLKKLNWLTVWEDDTDKRPERDLSFVRDKSMAGPYLLCPQ